jgi:hypothetical protein
MAEICWLQSGLFPLDHTFLPKAEKLQSPWRMGHAGDGLVTHGLLRGSWHHLHALQFAFAPSLGRYYSASYSKKQPHKHLFLTLTTRGPCRICCRDSAPLPREQAVSGKHSSVEEGTPTLCAPHTSAVCGGSGGALPLRLQEQHGLLWGEAIMGRGGQFCPVARGGDTGSGPGVWALHGNSES